MYHCTNGETGPEDESRIGNRAVPSVNFTVKRNSRDSYDWSFRDKKKERLNKSRLLLFPGAAAIWCLSSVTKNQRKIQARERPIILKLISKQATGALLSVA